MPIRNKKAQVAKQKRAPGRAKFTQRANTAGEDNDDYRPSDDNSDGSTTDTDRKGGAERDDQVVEGLRQLYSIFLPPHLRPKESTREKHRKISNRPAVYTGTSRISTWRKDVEQKKAAKGCATLDTFIIRKVCSARYFLRVIMFSISYCKQKRQRSPSPNEDAEDLNVNTPAPSVEDLTILNVDDTLVQLTEDPTILQIDENLA